MRTKGPVLFVLAVLVVSMAWGMAGVSGQLAGSNPAGGVPASQLNDTAGDANVNDDGLEGNARGADGSDIAGLIISGVQSVANIFGVAALLPFVLNDLGMPYYWAYPLGLLGQIIVFIGLVQMATGRQYL